MTEHKARILFVDDMEMIRIAFSKKLETRGYEVHTVANGREAIRLVTETDEHFDLVMSDIEMPETDGFDVINGIRKTFSKTELPIIMVTASPFSERVVRALNSGANDFISKENDFTVIVARIETQLSLKKASKELRDYANELAKMNERKDRELEIGQRIQEELLPDQIPELDLYEIGLKYQPSTELGGDFYNFVPLDDVEKTLVYLSDAAGHGVPAALLSALFKAQADLFLNKYTNFSDSIWLLNKRLHELLPGGKFISTFFLILDHDNQKVEYWKCSQEPGLLLIDGCNLKQLETNGILLGAFGPDMADKDTYFSSNKLNLRTGDRIVLYTDGVTEAENPDGEIFGDNRFNQLIRDSKHLAPQKFSEHVLAAVQEHKGAEHLEDDFSVLTIDIK